MTTIAWDGKELASDSMVYSDYIEQSPIKKILLSADDIIKMSAAGLI